MAIVIFTLLFMNIFDTVGTLVGLASKTGIMEEDGQIPHVKEAMMSDAIGTTVGSMMGSSTITTMWRVLPALRKADVQGSLRW